MSGADKSRICALVLAVAFVILGTVFTLWPETLAHSPVGFEKRGSVHHAWHYAILIGGLSLLAGLALHDRAFEIFGLVLCGAAVALNLAASITAGDESFQAGVNASVSGFGITLRVVVLAWIVLRLIDIDALGRRGDR